MFPALIDAGWQSGAVGFTTAKGSDVIGTLEELTAWIMEVSLGPVGNDLACYKLWLSNLHGCMLVIVFRPAFSSLFSFIAVRILVRNFRGIRSTNSIKWLNSVCRAIWLRKDKVCTLKIGFSHKGAEKCVMFLTWQMHRLAWWRWAWQPALLPGHLQGMCVFLYCCQELFSIVFQYSLVRTLY